MPVDVYKITLPREEVSKETYLVYKRDLPSIQKRPT